MCVLWRFKLGNLRKEGGQAIRPQGWRTAVREEGEWEQNTWENAIVKPNTLCVNLKFSSKLSYWLHSRRYVNSLWCCVTYKMQDFLNSAKYIQVCHIYFNITQSGFKHLKLTQSVKVYNALEINKCWIFPIKLPKLKHKVIWIFNSKIRKNTIKFTIWIPDSKKHILDFIIQSYI